MKWKSFILYFGIAVAVFLLSTYSTISILLKTGEIVICPDVRGKNVDDARALVQKKGLSLSVTKYERRNDVPYNHITIQKPEANISIRKGRVVLVMVSEGPELVKVPRLVGQSLEAAQETLDGVKLEVGKTISVPGEKPGTVIAQIPSAGEEVQEGKHEIVLFVAGPENRFYVMPDVRGLELSELANEFERKGIKYRAAHSYGRGDFFPRSRMGLETSVPSRAIFKAGDEIEIRVPNGG